MRELLMERKTEPGQDGKPYTFDYYVLVDELRLGENLACESYGVKVAAAEGDDAASIPNITTSLGRIDELMELLTRNFVTPATLEDVVADWL